MLPNFFLVGAAKAGTTSIHRYLAQHPEILMSPIKEPHFFADEVRAPNFEPEMRRKIEGREPGLKEYLAGGERVPFSGGPVVDWDDYLSLFRADRPVRIAGESSPCYLWSQSAPHNIASRCPGARIAMILRNPIERAFAQHVHMLMFADHPITFRRHLELAAASQSKEISELYPFLEFGLYSAQVRRYQRLFPARNIHICFYDDFLASPARVMSGIYSFAGIRLDFDADMSGRYMTASVPRSFAARRWMNRSGVSSLVRRTMPLKARSALSRVMHRPRASLTMSADDRAWLTEYYRDDVGHLSELLKRDLSTWLTPRPSN